MLTIQLTPFSADSPLLDEAVKLSIAEWPAPEDQIHGFIARYATLPDFRGLIALVDGEPAGMGFGVRSLPGNWWHDRVAEQVGADHPALQDAWVLVSLVMRPALRNHGIGAALLDALLATQPCPRTLLSTQVANTGAQRFYTRHGWRILHPGFVFTPGQEPFVVMQRER